MSANKTYTVLSPLKCGGKRRKINTPVELSEEDAEELLELSIIREGAPDTEELAEVHAGGEESGTDDDLAVLIAGTFAGLSEDDFTKTDPKRPHVKAVEKALKGQVDPKLITPELVASTWEAHVASSETSGK